MAGNDERERDGGGGWRTTGSALGLRETIDEKTGEEEWKRVSEKEITLEINLTSLSLSVYLCAYMCVCVYVFSLT